MAFSVRILRYPAQWYFLSLINVNVFGIYYANQGIQLNYVYDRSTAGKGTDEVNSMLHHFITNKYVVRMLLARAQLGDLETVELKLFIKGHPKKSVDRCFDHIRKQFAKQDVWTTDQMFEVINAAASSSARVHVPRRMES
ncbi:hypothetical protein L917_21514 [Phytophthora nicotianae]|uniref:DUF7869 domain-containing protein n=1 Tax=Phytophthora nicotianae TaxID=4792 RepID=W2JXE8_PHYNI|nr:hypothetical protein L917_21514 [Phytophthora nicotianae]